MFLLYNLLLTILSPIWVPWMLLRARKRKEAVNWRERTGDIKLPLFGVSPHPGSLRSPTLSPEGARVGQEQVVGARVGQEQVEGARVGQEPVVGANGGGPRIWLHAVSVGEVIAAKPILVALKQLLPEARIVLSVTTSSGHRTATETCGEIFDRLIYFPIDVLRFQVAAMTRVKPDVVVVMETELWMNFLWAAKSMKAKTFLVNGRISDRSFPRSRRIGFFYRALLRHLDFALMQTAVDADRIRTLGARNVEVLGNCKYDQAIEGLDSDPSFWRKELGISEDADVVVIGSTRGEEEEALVVEALSDARLNEVFFVHAPRHLESVQNLARLVQSQFGSVAQRTKNETGRYLILDTYGELMKVFCIADVVVMGGGFENHGGQNLLQPLAHGKPVIHGPHMQNFAEVTAQAAQAGATLVASNSQELADAVSTLVSDKERRRTMGDAAKKLIAGNTGASLRYAERITAAIVDR